MNIEKLSLDKIHFPKFNPEQLIFFNEMRKLTQQDILDLDPGKGDFAQYQLAFVSLKAMEQTYTWLIEYNNAILNAERKERIDGEEYNPQKEYEDMLVEDLTPEQMVHLL